MRLLPRRLSHACGLNRKQASLIFLSGSILCAVQWATADDNDFTRRPYIGLGAGLSELDPEAQCPCINVGDSTSNGFVLTGGYDLSRHFSIDGYYNYAGAAGIDFLGDRVGDLDYRMAGLSGIGYLFNSQGNEGLDRREGLSLFLRLGAGFMQNDSSLEFDRDHTAHVMAGVGAEYGWQNGVALRAELNSYDTDAQTLSLSLLKRFGTVPRRVVPVAPVAPEPVQREPETVVVENTVVNFAFAADALSGDALQTLELLASQLRRNTDVSLMLEGHTDNIDTEDYNQGLSERRAAAVKRWLVDNGIAQDRLYTIGFGENRPIASNNTTVGRAQNRRVEIRVR